MALSILDGNQSATTLSTILSSGQHITAHTVVSLGTQAITDMRGAVSGSVVSISNFPSTQTIAGTVTANLDPNASVIASQIETGIASYAADLANDPLPISGTVTVGNTVTIAGTVTANPTGTQTIAGTVTANAGSGFSDAVYGGMLTFVDNEGGWAVESLPPISGTVTANTFALQGTAVTTSNFTSTTASTVLASFNATREVLTIFNEGAGNLHICAGATCTTIAYQVRLSAGDYYEVPNHQTTITHSAVFATAGTARVTEVS